MTMCHVGTYVGVLVITRLSSYLVEVNHIKSMTWHVAALKKQATRLRNW